jgi:hypothetical protein
MKFISGICPSGATCNLYRKIQYGRAYKIIIIGCPAGAKVTYKKYFLQTGCPYGANKFLRNLIVYGSN